MKKRNAQAAAKPALAAKATQNLTKQNSRSALYLKKADILESDTPRSRRAPLAPLQRHNSRFSIEQETESVATARSSITNDPVEDLIERKCRVLMAIYGSRTGLEDVGAVENEENEVESVQNDEPENLTPQDSGNVGASASSEVAGESGKPPELSSILRQIGEDWADDLVAMVAREIVVKRRVKEKIEERLLKESESRAISEGGQSVKVEEDTHETQDLSSVILVNPLEMGLPSSLSKGGPQADSERPPSSSPQEEILEEESAAKPSGDEENDTTNNAQAPPEKTYEDAVEQALVNDAELEGLDPEILDISLSELLHWVRSGNEMERKFRSQQIKTRLLEKQVEKLAARRSLLHAEDLFEDIAALNTDTANLLADKLFEAFEQRDMVFMGMVQRRINEKENAKREAAEAIAGEEGMVERKRKEKQILDRYETYRSEDDPMEPTETPIRYANVRNWNDEFQKARSNPDMIERYSQLYNLTTDFNCMVDLYGKVIITERCLRLAHKVIKPVVQSSLQFSERFLVHGIRFKYANDSAMVYGSQLLAHKAMNNYMKGCTSFVNQNMATLSLALSAMIDYNGWRLLATAELPIDGTTVVYGCDNLGQPKARVRDINPTMGMLMKTAMQSLNLREHRVRGAMISGPGDLEGHCGRDNRFYVVSFGRLFPVDTNSLSMPGKYPYMLYMLRPELVRKVNRALSSDAHTPFVTSFDGQETNDDVTKAGRTLMEEVIPAFAQRLDLFPVATSDGYPKKFNLTQLMHADGINMRHLGSVKENTKTEEWRKVLVVEATSRVLKAEIRRALRDVTEKQMEAPAVVPYRKVTFGFMNMVFGRGDGNEEFWRTTVKTLLDERFPNILSKEELAPEFDFRQMLIEGDMMRPLVLRWTMSIDLDLSDKTLEDVIAQAGLRTGAPAISDPASFEHPPLVIRELPQATFARAYKLIEASDEATNTRVEKLLHTAQNILAPALVGGKPHAEILFLYAYVLGRIGRDQESELYLDMAIETDPNFILPYISNGILQEKKGDYKRAEEMFTQATVIDPTSVQALYNLGSLTARRGDTDAAIKFYRRAIESDPEHCDSLSNLGNLLFNSGKLEEAEQLYQQSLRSDDRHPNTNNNYGLLCFSRGETERAEKLLLKCIEMSPQHTHALFNYGNVLKSQKQFEKATKYYKRSVTADPSNHMALWGYGQLLKDEGHTKLAEENYKQSLSIMPTFAPALVDYAKLLLERGSIPQAEQLYQEAIKVAPEYVRGLHDYSKLLLDRKDVLKKDIANAHDLLTSAARLSPNDADIALTFGQCYVLRKDKTAAGAEYSRGINIDPNHSECLYNYAMIVETSVGPLRALPYIRRAVESAPTNGTILYHCGRMSKAVGEKEESLEFFRRAVEHAPNMHMAIYEYACMLDDENIDREQAERLYSRAMDLDMDFVDVHFRLGNIYLDHFGRPDDAERHYRIAGRLNTRHPGALTGFANCLKLRGEMSEATNIFVQALSIDQSYAPAMFGLAKTYHLQMMVKEAEQWYACTIDSDKSHADAYINFGKLMEETDRPEKAREYYKLAVDAQPHKGEAQFNYARVLEKSDEVQEAKERYSLAVDARPDNAEFALYYANILDKTGYTQTAKQLYVRVIELEPNRVEAYFHLAKVLWQSGELESALTHAATAVAMEDENPDLYSLCGDITRRMGREHVTKAIQYYMDAVKLNIEHKDSLFGLATLLDDIDETERSRRYYQRAIEVDLTNAEARYRFGWFLDRLNEKKQAKTMYVEALAIDPGHSAAAYRCARICHAAKSSEEADKYYQTALKNADPSEDSSEMKLNYGRLLRDTRRYRDASVMFQGVLNEKPEEQEAIYQLASVHQEIEELDEAQELLDRLLKLVPGHVAALTDLANIMRLKKDFAAAESYFKSAVAMAPEHAPAQYGLADLMRDRGDFEEANKHDEMGTKKDSTPYGLYRTARLKEFQKKYDEADLFYSMAIKAYNENVDALYHYALFHRDIRKSRPKTIEFLKKTIGILPTHANALYALGKETQQIGDENGAAKLFVRCVDTGLGGPYLQAAACKDYAFILKKRNEHSQSFQFFLRCVDSDPNDTVALNEIGEFLMERGKTKESVTFFRRCIESKEDFVAGHRNLAEARMKLSQLEEAESHFKRVLELEPENIDVMRRLLSIKQTQKKKDDTLARCMEMLKVNPKDIEALSVAARIYRRDAMYDKASEMYSQVVDQPNVEDVELFYEYADVLLKKGTEKDKNLATKYAMLGTNKDTSSKGILHYAEILDRCGKSSEARDWYQQLLVIMPTDPDAHFAFGSFLENLGELKDALKHYEEAVMCKTDHAPSLFAIGRFKEDAGLFTEAEEYMRACLKHDNYHADALNRYGQLLEKKGELLVAKRYYARAFEQKKDHIPALLNYGRMMQQGEAYDHAEDMYKRCLSIEPNSCDVLLQYGKLMLATDRPERAVELWEKGLAHDPTDLGILTTYGEYLQTVSDREKAAELFKRGAEAHPRDFRVVMHYIHEVIEHDKKEALRLLRTAIDVDPKNANATCMLADLIKEVGEDMDEAAMLYHRTLELEASNTNALCGLGNLMAFQKDMIAANDYFRRALNWDKSNEKTLTDYSIFLIERNAEGDVQEAEITLKKAVGPYLHDREKSLNINSALAFCKYADLHRNRGEFDEAKKYYLRGYSFRNFPSACINLALYYECQGELEIAESYYRNARSDIYVSESLVRFLTSEFYRSRGRQTDKEKADRIYMQAIDSDPEGGAKEFALAASYRKRYMI